MARWPGVGKADPLAEREVAVLIDLVGEIRNARASAKLPAADWLETLVYVPIELGPTFEALRPAIERLARARPLQRELTPEALEAAAQPGDLTVIVAGGEIEAAVRPKTTDADAGALERDRLVRDLAEAEGWLAAARERLANESFVSRGAGRRWSRPPGRARPSWPTRSTSSGTASNADPRPGSVTRRARSRTWRRPAGDRTRRRRLDGPAHDVARRPRVSRWSIRSEPHDARRGSPAGMPTVANASSNAPGHCPHLGRLDRRVEVAGHDDRRAHVVGGGGHRLDLGTSLLRAGIGQVGVHDAPRSYRVRPAAADGNSVARGSRTAHPRT